MSQVAYNIRRVPSRLYSSGCRHIELVLFGPNGEYIRGSSGPCRQMEILRDMLNDAYELGRVTGRLSAKGLLERPRGYMRTQLQIIRSYPVFKSRHG